MAVLIVIAIVILIGAFFLLRSPAPHAPTAPKVTEAEAQQLREAVIHEMKASLVGWTVEAGESDPLEIVATEEATQRRRVLNLKQLADAWGPLHAAGDQESSGALVQSFVESMLGEGEGEETPDVELLQAALALQLSNSATLPKGAISRDVGALKAVLVVRNPAGPEAVTREELSVWGLPEADAFQRAFENLRHEVEDGLTMQPLDEDGKSLQVAPGDPLAASYALVPALAVALRKKLGAGEVRYLLGKDELVAAISGENTLDGEALVEGPVDPALVAWRA